MPSTTTAEAKAALRRALAEQPAPDWGPMLAAFLALPETRAAHTLLLFYGVGREPDTRGLIETLLAGGKRIALPRCLPGRRMEARQITALAELRPGAYGIPEPPEDCPAVPKEAVDLVLAPNLCCDRQGRRLGHGGGYYDRWLAGFSGRSVALCPDAWLQEALPQDEFDVPVELVLTETSQWRGANPRAAGRKTLPI